MIDVRPENETDVTLDAAEEKLQQMRQERIRVAQLDLLNIVISIKLIKSN